MPKNRAELELEKDQVFPEYYIIPIKHFRDVVDNDLDEWIYSLKNSEVPADFKARNIDKLREKLDVLHMNPAERRQYDNYLLRRASDEGVLKLKHEEGREEGRKEGREEGIKEGLQKGMERGRIEGDQQKATAIAQNLLDILDDETIAGKTGLTSEQIKALRNT